MRTLHPSDSAGRRLTVSAAGAAVMLVLIAAGCSTGVAPSRTATGATTGATVGGLGGAVVGSQTSMGTGTGALGGAAAGAVVGGIVGMVQDSRDRKEQDRLSQERAYQQDIARRRVEETKARAAMEEELAIAEGFRISELELEEARKQLAETNSRLKKLHEERTAALNRKKELDEAREKTIATEAEIARLEEELARLRGDEFLYQTGVQPSPHPSPQSGNGGSEQ
jgi:uncharacterized protein YcfJ